MANDGEIVLRDIQETEFGENAVIESPFEAKNYIKFLPWKPYEEELEEYGSLREKAVSRAAEYGDTLGDEEQAALEAIEAYEESEGFSDDFATHNGWDQQAGAWTIDAEAFNEARKFWEFVGFDVKIGNGVDPSALR